MPSKHMPKEISTDSIAMSALPHMATQCRCDICVRDYGLEYLQQPRETACYHILIAK
jgi:hypothetical protein